MKTPYEFQEDAIQRITATPSFILADECGLGKTLTAIESAKRTRRVLPWRCLVVCPPSLLDQWEDEIREQDPDQDIYRVNRMFFVMASHTGYVLMSIYDLSSKIVRDSLAAGLFDMVILDEAHRIKNRKTQTAKHMKQIYAARKLALTGTPMEKSPANLWSILNFVAPDDFVAYWGWVMRHLEVEEGYFERFVVGGPKDPVAFGDMLSPYMLRRTKEQVAPQLPEKIAIHQRIDLLTAQKNAYNEIKSSKDILVQVENKTLEIANILSLITKLQQLSTDPELLGLQMESAKLLWLDQFLQDHVGEGIVIFTRFREVALKIEALYNTDIVIGGRRNLSDDPEIVVGTIDAMGEGLNFQWADHAIFLDAHWSATKMTQAIDRIHRINITEPKNLYFLWSTREDKLVLDAFENKLSEAELVYYFLHE